MLVHFDGQPLNVEVRYPPLVQLSDDDAISEALLNASETSADEAAEFDDYAGRCRCWPGCQATALDPDDLPW